ncbi:MAG: metallophosphoesterase [Clostridia bacterium]|nr:metallophosphoesterase [Clostridia bacterium]
MMKAKISFVKRVLSLLLCIILLFAALTANAVSNKDKQDITVNHSDSLSRLFHEKPAYCLYCSGYHSGTWGPFIQFFHNIAYFFCGIVGKHPDKGRMIFTFDSIDAGADEPFYFIHLGDNHLSFIDERDYGDARLVETANARFDYCPYAQRVLDDASLKAEELDAFIVHTGDLIDYVSQKNLDLAKDFTDQNDVFACAGNHEYHVYIWDDGEDVPRRERVEEKVQAAFSNNIRFSVREEHGVKFIAIDNSFHTIEQWQLDRFKEEITDGKPIILALHVPVYAPDIFEFQMTKLDYPHPAWLMAVPEDLMAEYNYEPQWIEEQKANDATKEFYDLIVSTASLKAILVGHDHAHFVSQVTPTLKQYMVACEEGQIFVVN